MDDISFQCFQHTHAYTHTQACTHILVHTKGRSNNYRIFLTFQKSQNTLEDNLAIPVADIVCLFDLNSSDSSNAVDQLLKAYPVMNVSLCENSVLINCHNLVMSSGCFECLFRLGEQKEMPKQRFRSPSVSVPSSSSEVTMPGRPSLVSKFPEIVPNAMAFIKQHGYRAHERRRQEVGKVGVTISEILDHLLATVPNVKDHGISKASVARLMKPPRCGTIASKRYKRLIAAKVPGKCNEYREDNIDQHYLFVQVAYRKEFSIMFKKECALFSCDDMNKIKVGALAVSRYHQL